MSAAADLEELHAALGPLTATALRRQLPPTPPMPTAPTTLRTPPEVELALTAEDEALGASEAAVRPMATTEARRTVAYT